MWYIVMKHMTDDLIRHEITKSHIGHYILMCGVI